MKSVTTPPTNSDRVIESFQQTMRAFLEVQRSTMLAYLTGRGPARAPAARRVLCPQGASRSKAEVPAADRLRAPLRREDLPERGGSQPATAGTYSPPTLAAADPVGHRGTSSAPPANGQTHDPAPAIGLEGRTRLALREARSDFLLLPRPRAAIAARRGRRCQPAARRRGRRTRSRRDHDTAARDRPRSDGLPHRDPGP